MYIHTYNILYYNNYGKNDIVWLKNSSFLDRVWTKTYFFIKYQNLTT